MSVRARRKRAIVLKTEARKTAVNKTQARRRKFVDRPIQGALVLRVMLYWVVGMLVQALLVAFLAIVTSTNDDVHVRAGEFWWHLKLVAFSSLCILPLLMMDMIRLSHRWVGPIYRLRTALQALARGEQQPPLKFRDGDFWQELAADFNAAAARVNGALSADEEPVEEGTEVAASR